MTRIWKWLGGAAAVLTTLSMVGGAAVWAADTRYVTVIAQQQSEMRQLKRDIKRLELKKGNGNSTPEDDAFLEYLKEDLEYLEQIQ